ncbi:MMPL family transporter [Gorillibacterium massiliense]|uniref:MMPL family transporter n=1 Tax=Gorillibacterium massiliense TaxID=1280390 RepID=UPI000594CB3B|nr:MMPL family transporter [Gorillibacterium massiliense]
MRIILKLKWVLLVLWIAIAAILVTTAPSMESLVREKGQITVPDNYSFSRAAKLLDEMGKDTKSGGGVSTVLAFHSKTPFTDADNQEIKRGIDKLKADQQALGITSITTYQDNEQLASQMLSADKTTALVLMNVTMNGRTEAEARDALYQALDDNKVEHYFTGNWLIVEDVVQSSQDGLKKTEIITVIFILVILIIVFRSVVAPFIPLIAVGFSYLTAQSVVAYLVDWFDFPLSNFSQIFIVAILFGIGTDYCILLISRFKEELAAGATSEDAVLTTYRTAGRTVLVSGAAVLVGFSTIGLSTFSLYRSAVGVAVGVAVMLLALATLVPFFLSVLGKKLFWPSKGSLEHRENRLWGTVGGFSLKRPLAALALIAIITVPFLVAYKGTVSFNSLDELGSGYKSAEGFDIIANAFGPGDTLPTTVVLKSDQPLATQQNLALIEQVSRELAKVDGVKMVRSATRPTGDPLADLQVAGQAGTVGSGLGKSSEGLDKIGSGLTDASKSLSANAPKLKEAAAGAEKLQAGTKELQTGVTQLGDGLKQLQSGLQSGSAGAGDLAAGLKQAKASADQLAAGSSKLLQSYQQLGGGLSQLATAYGGIADKAAGLGQGLTSVGQGLDTLAKTHPELLDDPVYTQTRAAVTQLQTGAQQLSAGLMQINGQLADLNKGLSTANTGFAQAADGQKKLAGGLASLSDGIARLQTGVAQAADGQGAIVAKLPELTAGFDQLVSGQQQLAEGYSQLDNQLSQLTSGLDQSVDGIGQISTGLRSAQGYLNQLSGAPNQQLAGWYMPEEALSNADFQKALDVYMSKDRKITKIDVVLSDNPYGKEAMNKSKDLEQAVDRALKGTALAKSEYAVGGVTSMNSDLREMSHGDYTRTVILMLAGIAVILILLFRSLIIPLYLILSLVLTYYTSMAITEVIFVRILGYSGLTWAVPFFGFVMLMALGVDYSIFLMDRFKEYRHLPAREAILAAMKNMGSVIMSAAVILGGTFAAMMPSGVLSLMIISVIVLCGLFLYALIMLPLFIPVMVRTFGPANWWPFMGKWGANSHMETPED